VETFPSNIRHKVTKWRDECGIMPEKEKAQ